MVEELTEVDILLLERWTDTVGIRDAIKELEDRLADRLQAVAERLRPWLENQGYDLLEVERKFAAIHIVKKGWMKNREDAFMCITIGDLFPIGYRSVEEEHPYVWLTSDGLTKDQQQLFQVDVSSRLKDGTQSWLSENCTLPYPVGRYISSYGDSERVGLAKSEESLESFIKAELGPMLLLGEDFDAALKVARGPKPARARG